MVAALRERMALKRPLKIRDGYEQPAVKRQNKASTAPTKAKPSKGRQAAGERSKERNARAKGLETKTHAAVAADWGSNTTSGRCKSMSSAKPDRAPDSLPDTGSRGCKRPAEADESGARKRQATQATRAADEQGSQQVDVAAAEPASTCNDRGSASETRTKITLRMPAAPSVRQQQTSPKAAVAPLLRIAEPEVAPSPTAVASSSLPVDSDGEGAEAHAQEEPGPSRIQSPAKRRSAQALARHVLAEQAVEEEEEAPRLSAFAKARLDLMLARPKVGSFRGGAAAPGRQNPSSKAASRVKKSKPAVSAAEEVRRTERWARSFLQEAKWEDSPAVKEAALEILREKTKQCPRGKLAVRRFKYQLRDWALKNGLQPALADALADAEVEQARCELHAFLELTKDSRKGLERLGEW